VQESWAPTPPVVVLLPRGCPASTNVERGAHRAAAARGGVLRCMGCCKSKSLQERTLSKSSAESSTSVQAHASTGFRTPESELTRGDSGDELEQLVDAISFEQEQGTQSRSSRRSDTRSNTSDSPLKSKSKVTLDRQLLLKSINTNRSLTTVSSARLHAILQLLEPSSQQLKFFQVWTAIIYDEVLPLCEPQGQLTLIATDLTYMEIRLLAVTDKMMEAMRNFMVTCKIPTRQFEAVEKVVEELEPQRLTLWCKLKNLGKNKPTVDTGISIQRSLDWAIVDVLMPAVEDQDALRKYALKQRYVPVMYGSSVLPIEPEKHLAFEVTTEETHVSQKQLFVASFLFFKSLGFTKPEDKVDRLLGSCANGRFLITVLMGPKGLTRVSMSVIEPKKEVAAELAFTLGSKYREEVVNEIKTLLDGEADILDYVADSRGYTVSLGFVA